MLVRTEGGADSLGALRTAGAPDSPRYLEMVAIQLSCRDAGISHSLSDSRRLATVTFTLRSATVSKARC